MLSEIDKVRVPLKISRGGVYVSGGAPEILERLKLLSQKKTANSLDSVRNKNSTSEESAR